MRRLLDLQDLMEDELCNIYQAEKKLLPFLNELKKSTDLGPLLDWINIYYEITQKHDAVLKKMIFRLFVQLDDESSYVIEEIIKDYHDAANRTFDEPILEEESILALFHIIHYKIASYSVLCIHAKALKLWDELIELDRSMKEEKEMEANLSFISEKHHVFINDWYRN